MTARKPKHTYLGEPADPAAQRALEARAEVLADLFEDAGWEHSVVRGYGWPVETEIVRTDNPVRAYVTDYYFYVDEPRLFFTAEIYLHYNGKIEVRGGISFDDRAKPGVVSIPAARKVLEDAGFGDLLLPWAPAHLRPR